MENDQRCICRNYPIDSEIYCPVHTTTEDYLQTVESMYERVERQSVENIVNRFRKIRKEKDMEKYYTPDISDIRVGYECENRLPGKGWLRTIIKPSDAIYIDSFIKDLRERNLRTPYLTKEEIKSEGWEIVNMFEHNFEDRQSNFYMFNKNDKYQVRWWGKPDYIEIYDIEDQKNKKAARLEKGEIEWCIFQGKCPSINEFRFINKLLDI